MTYLGSSIVSFSEQGSLAGGGSEHTAEIVLIDCAVEGNMFTPPTIGTPSLFSFNGHTYYGLIDRYSTSYSSSGYPQYTVHLTNGIFLLQGVKVILNDYYGASNAIPNLVNVFGYLENSGFGNSEVNEAGISWSKIATSLTTIVNTAAGTSYGGPVKHKSFNYGIDLSNLPAIPAYYRINSDSISLLEFIQEVCEAGGHDFFIKLETTASPGLDGKFKVYTISRLTEPTPGAVQSFINSSQCVVQKEIGQELRKDPTSKFVVGANLERMWFVEPASSGSISGGITSEEYTGYNVLPYYGQDTDGNYIVGYTYEDEPDEYYFDIDIREVAHPNLGDTYTTCYGELRAAKKGRDSWERYLAERSCNEYNIVACADVSGASPFVIPYPSSVNSPFKADPAVYDQLIDDGYFLQYVPKYGYTYCIHKEFANPPGIPFVANDYYYLAKGHGGTNYPPSLFTTASCEINSLVNKVPDGPDRLLWNLYYPHNGVANPYFLRAFRIGNVSAWSIPFARMFESDLYRLSDACPVPADKTVFQNLYETFQGTLGKDQFAEAMYSLYNTNRANRFENIDNRIQEKATHLYRIIKNLADNYHGKRFAITIPSTYGAIEPESNQLRLSQEPVDAGYIDEAAWDDAYVDGLIPEVSGLNILLSPEEKFYPFVKIENAVLFTGVTPNGVPVYVPYNYSEIAVNDRYLGNPISTGVVVYDGSESGIFPDLDPGSYPWISGYYCDLWVKCNVSPNIVFRDNSTLFSPRAILDLPGPITSDPLGNAGAVQAMYKSIVEFGQSDAGAFGNDPAFTDAKLAKILNKLGIDEQVLSDGSTYRLPDLFAVPLKSNILCYGPWYLAGANGPVEYEKNNDLAPWNYGGYTPLDSAGFARVTDGMTNQTFDETGSVTVVGAPALNIGDALIAGGPYITDINVSTGADGVNTQYTFQSWSSQRRLSKLTNFTSERVRRLSQTSRDLRRSYREGLGGGLWSTPAQFIGDIKGKFLNLSDLPKRDQSNTSHGVIAGEVQGYNASVVIQPGYNAGSQTEDSYNDKAIMSLDGLFRPYSTIAHSSMSSLTFPENTGDTNTSWDLNPLRMGHDITILTGGSGETQPVDGASNFTTNIETDGNGTHNYRGLALKGPAILQGYGNDLYDDPVPLYVDSSGDPILTGSGHPYGSGVKQHRPDYLFNSKEWKTGPLDLKWNEAKGVWSPPGIRIGIASVEIGAPSGLFHPTSGEIYDYHYDLPNNTGERGKRKTGYVFDASLGVIESGTLVYYYEVGNINHIVYVACEPDADAITVLEATG